MFLLRRPDDRAIAAFLARQRAARLSYHPQGIIGRPPPGFDVDFQRVRIGSGAHAFEAAKAALEAWAMFDLGWVSLHPAGAPTSAGSNVAVLVRHWHAWSLNACRVLQHLPAPPRRLPVRLRLRHARRPRGER